MCCTEKLLTNLLQYVPGLIKLPVNTPLRLLGKSLLYSPDVTRTLELSYQSQRQQKEAAL